ncbi:MAG TPA: GNAT family N-acetyltransferase [Methyloceanibacter sp.]
MNSGRYFSASTEHDAPFTLVPLSPADCPSLAAAIVAMEPWSVMDYPADRLSEFLASPDGGVTRCLIEVGGERAGVISVRYPWLKGPYLELLALLPPFQRKGIGGMLLERFESEAVSREARNLFVCASSFNENALRFYRSHGFRDAAVLPGLVAEGYDEILLRKFLIG